MARDDGVVFFISGITRGLGFYILEKIKSRHLGDYRLLVRDASAFSNESGRLIEIDFATTKKLTIEMPTNTKHAVFINNAASIEPIQPMASTSSDEWQKHLMINLVNPALIAGQLAGITKQQGALLTVFNITSGAAARPIHGWGGYCASKAAAKMALDVLSIENQHAKVIHFDPGVMDTDMQETIRRQSVSKMADVDQFRSFKENKQLKHPADVAEEIIDILHEVVR